MKDEEIVDELTTGRFERCLQEISGVIKEITANVIKKVKRDKHNFPHFNLNSAEKYYLDEICRNIKPINESWEDDHNGWN